MNISFNSIHARREFKRAFAKKTKTLPKYILVIDDCIFIVWGNNKVKELRYRKLIISENDICTSFLFIFPDEDNFMIMVWK